jgi:hypothetical protein
VGADPITAGIGLGLSALGIFSSSDQARKQNKAAGRSAASARAAAEVEQRQLNQRAAVERQNRIREAQRTRGAILAAAGETGFDTQSGDFLSLVDNNQTLTEEDLRTLGLNLIGSLDRSNSELDSRLASIGGSRSNTVTSGLLGGAQGLSTGLSIGGGLSSLFGGATSAGATASASRFIGPPTP